MFEKTLTDVVKGIRASKRDTALYISQCIAEIKDEINSTDPYVKANALQKITFLQMMGYSMSWASFASIEVMSFPRFAHKRIGYLAASQGFTQDTDVILLTTNLLKKELRGAVGVNMKGVYEAGLAINCLSNIVTEDLARDLLPEVTNLTKHPQPYLRKKAVLCLFKLFVKYPQGLRLTFAKVQQCLDDQNPSVVSCAVNVVTELSDKNPRNYLHLAPAFFQLLTSSSNNWMLIKVVKLLGSLVQEEPRLARKLLEPLASIVKSTQAKSLLYEAVHTITLSLPYCRKADGTMPPSVPGIITLCAQTLREFVEESDQNLKYLGLVGFGSLMASHPKVLMAPDYRPLILACLSDEDVTIRTRALDLLGGMATRKNLRELVSQLYKHVELATGEYKNDLVLKIIEMCSSDRYALLQDFAWYLDILLELGHERGIDVHAELLSSQVYNIALRVLPVRAYAVQRGIEILYEGEKSRNILQRNIGENQREESGTFAADNGRGKHIMADILPSVGWLVGEYSDLIRDVDKDSESVASMCQTYKGLYHGTIESLLAPSNTRDLQTTTQSMYVQSAGKVFAAATGDDKVSGKELEGCLECLAKYLPLYMQSTDVEVQERAFTLYELLRALEILVGGSFGAGVPDLAPVGNCDDDDSSNDGDSAGADLDGDLLGVGSDTIQTQRKNTKPPKSAEGATSTTVTSRCRSASSTLQYLLKPEPMKPISTKAQRKKRQCPIGFSVEKLDAPVDLSVFADLLERERSHRPSGGGRVSLECVSFTQQRPLRSVSSATPVSSMDQSAPLEPIKGEEVSGSAYPSSFQSTAGVVAAGAVAPQLNRPPNQHDPFYLASGGESNMAAKAREQQSNVFGAIQLVDSDGEEEREARSKRKKHNKKDKKRKKKKGREPTTQIGLEDFAMLSIIDKTSKPAGTTGYTVYSSEEDEPEEKKNARVSISGRGKSNGVVNKEFEGLANVDLTTPLRDDEVMPKREHHVVAERPPAADTDGASSDAKKKKKKKDSKRAKTAGYKKRDKYREDEKESSATTCDLLDLGMFASTADVSAVPASTSSVTVMQSNPINTAFDDLLGLSAESGSSVVRATSISPRDGFESLGGASPMPTSAQASNTKSSRKHPWLKCNVKASGGSGTVDWGKVSLYVKVYSHSGGAAAMIKFRVVNLTDDMALDNLVVKLKEKKMEDIMIGNIFPGEKGESSVKSGPIPCDALQGSATDIRGSIVTSTGDSSVSFKLTLPATLGLVAVPGLSQESVLAELSTGQWSSHSVTIQSPSVENKVKSIVGSFLQAAEVEGENTDLTAGTFAATLPGGAIQVRALVKVKPSSVKVDLKCTDASLGKALVSSLKKIVL